MKTRRTLSRQPLFSFITDDDDDDDDDDASLYSHQARSARSFNK
jgi:hypothetical protein